MVRKRTRHQPSSRKRDDVGLRRPGLGTEAPGAGGEVCSEALDTTSEALSVYDCVKTRLEEEVLSLPVDLAVMLREEQERFIPALHVFPVGKRETSSKLACNLADHAAIETVLRTIPETGFRSENFQLADGKPLTIGGYAVRNIGVVALDCGSWVVVFVNRTLEAGVESDDPDLGVLWDTTELKRLRLALHVSPLQISHAVFAMELSDLLKTDRGKWVVYWKAERLGIRPTAAEAEQIAIDRGIPEEETYLRLIEEQIRSSFGGRSLDWR